MMAKDIPFIDTQQSVDDDLKKYRQRDLSQTLLFKVASKTFGPPKSRKRRIIAPPMEKLEPTVKDNKMVPFEALSSCYKPDIAIDKAVTQERDAQQEQADWTLDEEKLEAQLNNMGDLKTWLQGKPQLTELETRVWDRIMEEKPQSQISQVTTLDVNSERSYQKSPMTRRVTPSIKRPCPDALGILDHYLQQSRLRLVDLYNQTDKRKNKKISSRDLKSVRNEARIPITDLQFDDLVISLSSKHPNVINYKELSRARDSWRSATKEERRNQPATQSVGLNQYQEYKKRLYDEVRPLSVLSGSSIAIRGSKNFYSEGSRSQYLQIPPVNTEERRPLTYEDMEEIGKMYRERRRRGMSNTRLLTWLEKCRVVRTGNIAIDSHSLPSTLGEGTAASVEKYRRQYLQHHYKILQLCHHYGVPIAEKQLERALLYPGDKLVHSPDQHLKIRQPGIRPIHREDLPKRQQSGKRDYRDSQSRESAPKSSLVISDRVSMVTAESGQSLSGRSSSGISSGSLYPPSTHVRPAGPKVIVQSKAQHKTLRSQKTREQSRSVPR